ncbi:MAG: hypothetical protein A2Y62_00690 [Candidatus Fischerbacteria bacterium RBG_13_37_8]|uniref:C-type cytochrome biogenesis protein CcmI n=1 Tax=Candidatus Fischerbacteria bacterium RBG_13_37_8 TaxID=1817863 RepID=A0A1F5VNN7_9BACT|nr:MAG: hypothetical protein A2Y62_00690 [Candidatus Fischerbacteria bacterium RBG_13_37_8]
MFVLFIILVVLLIIYIFTPLFFRKIELNFAHAEAERQKLIMQKVEVYNSIKDLEYDYRQGKIAEDDYIMTKNQLTEEAIEILKELDKRG